MPERVVEIPGVGNVAFPASMSDADVSAQAARLYRESQQQSKSATPQQPAAPPTTNLDRLLAMVGAQVKPEINDMAASIDQRDARNAERDRNRPADLASRLPAPLQFPVGAGLSLVEPATEIAGVLSGGGAALRGARAATTALSKPADVALAALVKRMGLDPDAMDVASAKMRLQSARSKTRQGKIAGQIANASPAESTSVATPSQPSTVADIEQLKALIDEGATTSRGARGPVGEQSASGRGAPAPRAASTAPEVDQPPTRGSVASGLPKPRLTAAEQPEYLRLLKTGKTPQQAMELIQGQRAFLQRMGLPSGETVRGSVGDRNATGRWREE